MFTGIVENTATVINILKKGSNVEFLFESKLANEFKIDQSVSHNGVCLTVVDVSGNTYKVIAVEETLVKSNLGSLGIGEQVNLERSMLMNSRLDGHIVQGHVDQVGICQSISNKDGSFILICSYEPSQNMTVEKGSICINGISLTVFDSKDSSFSVAIIPYTWEHTNLKLLKVGGVINLEFDILGKYIAKIFNKSH
jgi:riboflavin synthase